VSLRKWSAAERADCIDIAYKGMLELAVGEKCSENVLHGQH
jgi:hypothetical protein